MSDIESRYVGPPAALRFPPLTDEERTERLAELAKQREKIGNPLARAFGREDLE